MTSAGEGNIDFEGLELIDIRLDIDVDRLLSYLIANSDFPTGPAEVKQFNKGQSNPTYFIEDSNGARWVLRYVVMMHLRFSSSALHSASQLLKLPEGTAAVPLNLADSWRGLS